MYKNGDFQFGIAISGGSTKANGNLKWQLANLGLFDIDKQKQIGILLFRIAISPGLLSFVSNLKEDLGVFLLRYFGSLVSRRAVQSTRGIEIC